MLSLASPAHLLLQLAELGRQAVDADPRLLQFFVGGAHHAAVPLRRLLGVLQLQPTGQAGLAQQGSSCLPTSHCGGSEQPRGRPVTRAREGELSISPSQATIALAALLSGSCLLQRIDGGI